MQLPKITIITITYNSEKTIERTIKSVLSQNYDNLEYIIVDGGSTDATMDIVKKYEDGISKWISEKDNGISDAFNKGIRMASGELIGIINSDDGLESDALRRIAEAYSPEIEVYRGNVVLWNEETDSRTLEIPSISFEFGSVTKVSHQGTFVLRSAYEKYGVYDTNCRYVMDYDLLLRFYHAGAVFKWVDYPVAFYSLGGLTATCYNKKRHKELVYVLKKNGAKVYHILHKTIVRITKEFVKKILGKDLARKIKNSVFNKAE